MKNPPYHSVRNRQTNAALAAQQSHLYDTTGRQSLLNDPLQGPRLPCSCQLHTLPRLRAWQRIQPV